MCFKIAMKNISRFLEKNLTIRWCIWLLYIVLLCFVSYYHEPWHDEAQAWLIARDDSLWHLLTYTTHWEGHPPLWHLCLMPFAKLGVSFPLGLKAVNIFFCSVGMFFLIIKSPLPWLLRFGVPFTYFCFYQFGIVNRTYSLLMAAIFVAAYYYHQRMQKSFHLALTLVIMSGAQAYGMMIAIGIAIVWTLEILKENVGKMRIYNNRNARAVSVFLLLTFLFGLCILPRADTKFFSDGMKNGFWQSLFFNVVVLPGQIIANNELKDMFTNTSFGFFKMELRYYWV